MDVAAPKRFVSEKHPPMQKILEVPQQPAAKPENSKHEIKHQVVGRAPKNTIVNDYDKNFKDITCPKKREIVNNYDKNYSEVTKPIRREFVRESEKNFSDITHVKKREIRREEVVVEGSKPKKIRYGNDNFKRAPEVTVVMCGENGP